MKSEGSPLALTGETSRQKDRSNNTGIPTQESFTGIQEQTSSSGQPETPDPTPVQGDDEGKAGAEKTEGLETPTKLEGDEGLPLFENDETLVKGTKLSQAATTENLPGAAAGGWAILALQPIPREELEARPPRDPESMKVLRALMQASSPKRVGHLHEQLGLLTTGGIPRDLFTQLTDEELDRARTAAKYDAPQVKGGVANAGYHALDHLIGERVTVERLTGQRVSTDSPPMGQAYVVVNEPSGLPHTVDPENEPLLDLRTKYLGLWRQKKTNEVVEVIELVERPGDAPVVRLKSGKELSIWEIATQHRRPEDAQASA